MNKPVTVLLLCLSLFTHAVFSTELYLKNGNRLTITGLLLENGTVTGKFFNNGISVPWEQIKRIRIKGKHFVTLTDRSFVAGGEPKKLSIASFLQIVHQGQLLDIAKDKIVRIETEQHYHDVLAAKKAEEKKGLGRFWAGSTDIGYQADSGNTSQTKLNYLIKMARSSEFDVFHIELSGSQGESKQEEISNRGKLKTRFDLKHRKNSFYFLLSSLEYDKIKKIDLRSVLGLGAGWTLIDTPDRRFQWSFGVTSDKEQREDNTSKSTLSSLIACEFKRKIFGKSWIEGDLNIYPDFRDIEENIKGDGRISLVNPINDKASFKISLQEKYQNNVLPTVEKRDRQIITSISYKF